MNTLLNIVSKEEFFFIPDNNINEEWVEDLTPPVGIYYRITTEFDNYYWFNHDMSYIKKLSHNVILETVYKRLQNELINK